MFHQLTSYCKAFDHFVRSKLVSKPSGNLILHIAKLGCFCWRLPLMNRISLALLQIALLTFQVSAACCFQYSATKECGPDKMNHKEHSEPRLMINVKIQTSKNSTKSHPCKSMLLGIQRLTTIVCSHSLACPKLIWGLM